MLHKLKQFGTGTLALRYFLELKLHKNIVFDFHKIRWYIVESNCKVNFARGFLFEVVITKQVRSKSGNQLQKESLKAKRGRKYWRRREEVEEGFSEVTRLKGHPCTFSIYLMAPKNDLVS